MIKKSVFKWNAEDLEGFAGNWKEVIKD